MAIAEFGFARQPDALVNIGPTVVVRVGLGRDVMDEGSEAREHLALVDTGALNNCIDHRFARALGLNSTGHVRIGGVGGLFDTEMYAAHVYIPALDFLIVGRFMGVSLHGEEGHAVLLGRAFLRHFTMTYDGPSGSVILATPSSS